MLASPSLTDISLEISDNLYPGSHFEEKMWSEKARRLFSPNL
jgi:hypothetical protein